MMVSMQTDELFDQLKDFLQTDEACIKTLTCLKPQAQIGIVVGGALEVCVQVPGGEIQVEKARCMYPDFVFRASPQAVEVMIAEKGMTPAQLGIKFLKQFLTQQIKLAMPGHLFQILRKGYLDILKVGGLEFLAELKKHNLASVGKIIKLLRGLTKR